MIEAAIGLIIGVLLVLSLPYLVGLALWLVGAIFFIALILGVIMGSYHLMIAAGVEHSVVLIVTSFICITVVLALMKYYEEN